MLNGYENIYESTSANTPTTFVKTVFILLLIATIFLPTEIVFAFYMAVIFICLHNVKWKMKPGLLLLVNPLLLLFVLGMAHAYWNSFFVATKDAWYLVKIIFTLGTGYFLMHYLMSNFLAQFGVQIPLLQIPFYRPKLTSIYL